MFCGKCGEQINGNEKFCPKCGTPVVNSLQKGTVGTSQAEGMGAGNVVPKQRPPYLAIGLIVIIALIVVIAAKAIFFSSGYETTVKKFIKAAEKQDVKLLISTMPDEIFDVLEEQMDLDRDEIIDNLDDMVSGLTDEYDGKTKIKYEIDDIHTLKKSEISEIEEDMYDLVKIKEGKSIELFMEIYIDGDKEEEEELSLNVIKVGRKWYIDPTSL